MTCSEMASSYHLKDYSKVVATGISLTIAILILAALSWDSLQDGARFVFQQGISSRLENEIDTKFFQKYPEYAERLAGTNEIIMLAQGQTVPDNQEVMIILQTAKQMSGASIVYVMDRIGTVVGCSSYDKGESLTGKNYSFRPYFTQALKGEKVAYPALGVTTDMRGIYFSTPIYSRTDSSPVGVVVIKTLLDPIDAFLDQIKEPVALLSPDGIIFATNRSDWMFHAALPIEEKSLAGIRKSRQFSNQPLTPLGARLDDNTVEVDGIDYTVRRIPIRIKGWQIGTLASLKINYAIPTQQLLVFWGGLAFLVTLSVSTVVLLLSISKRKIVEKELRSTEEKYRSIFENAVEGIIQTTLDGRFLSANPTLAAILGYSNPHELMTTITDIPRQIFVDSNQWEELIQRLHKDKAVSEFDTEFYRKDRSIVIISINARIVKETDRPAYIDGFLNDISKRKKAEKDLLESEERYRNLFNNISDFVYTHDLSGRILDINRIPAQSLGYTREELVGKKISDIMPQKNKWAFSNEYLPEIEKEKQQSGLLALLATDGSEHIISYHNHLVMEEKGTPYVRGSARDITEQILAARERKNLEAQLRQAQKMESIGVLAGGIAHDFNNILSIIFGYLHLAMMSIKNPDKLQKDLAELNKGALRAKDLINQILTFSRRKEQEKQPLRMSMIIKEALTLLRSSIPSTIEIKQNIDSQKIVLADATQLHQIIMNLCTNAYHAMFETGGTLTVCLKDIIISEDETISGQKITPGEYLQIEVSDTGHGMDKEIKEKIFEPYFTTKEIGEGTGLGLAVVHGIVKSHNGFINVYSEVSKGATFHVYLPVFEEKFVSVKPAASKEPVKGGSERVLFVDDEEKIAQIAHEVLTKYGYQVTLCTNGVQALQEFESNSDQYDLVIADILMPHMNGVELAKRIFKLKPHFPIILCSGFSELINKEKAAALGVTYFKKPIIMSELVRTIRKVLDEV